MTNMRVSPHAIYFTNKCRCIETYEFELWDNFSIFHVCKPSPRTCSHVRRVQGEEQWGEPHSAWCRLLPSIATRPEELPAAGAQYSAAAFVSPSGHKAVSLIIAHLECSHLTDLPKSASESMGVLDFAHYFLAFSCTPLPWIIRLAVVRAHICTTVSVVFGTFKAPSGNGDSGYLSQTIFAIFGIFISGLGYIFIIKVEQFTCYR